MRIEYVELDKLCQGRVIVNLGTKNDPTNNVTVAVPMMWAKEEEIPEMEKANVEAVVKQYKCVPEETDTILIVARTGSVGYYYVGMFTLNKDRLFLGLHDLVEKPALSNIELREIK